jgi:hypothetical protein
MSRTTFSTSRNPSSCGEASEKEEEGEGEIMPLTTYMGFTTNPDIFIKVSDGGGGGGNDHTVDLTVTYDTAVLQFMSGSDNCVDMDAGVCGWSDVFCPADGKTFTVEFSRLTSARTYVTAVAVDDAAGEVDSDQLILPRVSRPLSASRTTRKIAKTAKKLSKKTRRKA